MMNSYTHRYSLTAAEKGGFGRRLASQFPRMPCLCQRHPGQNIDVGVLKIKEKITKYAYMLPIKRQGRLWNVA